MGVDGDGETLSHRTTQVTRKQLYLTPLPLSDNVLMCILAGSVTPLMFLRSLTALKPMGVVGCCTIFTLAACIFYRVATCGSQPPVNLDEDDDYVIPTPPPTVQSYFTYVEMFGTWSGVLDSLPIFICTFVCHFNVLPVHDELTSPTRRRLRRLIHTTFGVTVAFYGFVGGAGMGVGRCGYYPKEEEKVREKVMGKGWRMRGRVCKIFFPSLTPLQSKQVKGNVLLNFPSTDNLMSLGRACLACTITLAFPLLVIPCRDMIVRIIQEVKTGVKGGQEGGNKGEIGKGRIGRHYDFEGILGDEDTRDMEEPLIQQAAGERSTDELGRERLDSSKSFDSQALLSTSDQDFKRFGLRKVLVTLLVFWGGLLGATCVDNIEVVWDVLGSSISILVAFLIPCACYLVVSRGKELDKVGSRGEGTNNEEEEEEGGNYLGGNYVDGSEDGYDSTPQISNLTPGRETTTEGSSVATSAKEKKRKEREKVETRRRIAKGILGTFAVLMVVCTGNAVMHLVNHNS